MNKCLVLYGSVYGATKQYAQAIATACGGIAKDAKDVKQQDIQNASIILYGGGMYAGGMHHANDIRKYEAELLTRPLVLFTCGIADPNDQKNAEKLKEDMIHSLGSALVTHAHCFHLRGNLLYSKMKFKHRMMMKMLVTMIKKKVQSQEGEDIIRTYGKDTYFYDEQQIQGILLTLQTLKEKPYESQE